VLPTQQPLTYLAQVRQLPCKNARLCLHRAYTAPLILPTKHRKKYGIFLKETVTTGIVRVAVWDVQNKNMGEWSKVVECWLQVMFCTSLLLRVGEKK